MGVSNKLIFLEPFQLGFHPHEKQLFSDFTPFLMKQVANLFACSDLNHSINQWQSSCDDFVVKKSFIINDFTFYN